MPPPLRELKFIPLLDESVSLHPPLRELKLSPSLDETISLPSDVVEEILKRLPLKKLFKFKCTSKPWSSMIQVITSKRIEDKVIPVIIKYDEAVNEVVAKQNEFFNMRFDREHDFRQLKLRYERAYLAPTLLDTIVDSLKKDDDVYNCYYHVDSLRQTILELSSFANKLRIKANRTFGSRSRQCNIQECNIQ